MRVAALIPAHNEAERIAATVHAASSIPDVNRVLVVDDGSEDETAERAASAGAEVIRLDVNRGKGEALEEGAAFIGDDADIVLLLDADLGTTATEGAALLAPVLAGDADMTIATFPPPEHPAGFGLVKGTARRGIHWLGDRRFPAEAPLSGQRAVTRACLERVRPFAAGYGVELALTVRALRSGCRLLEVPTTMAHAATGRDAAGFRHRGGQLVDVIRALGSLAFEPRAGRSGSRG